MTLGIWTKRERTGLGFKASLFPKLKWRMIDVLLMTTASLNTPSFFVGKDREEKKKSTKLTTCVSTETGQEPTNKGTVQDIEQLADMLSKLFRIKTVPRCFGVRERRSNEVINKTCRRASRFLASGELNACIERQAG